MRRPTVSQRPSRNSQTAAWAEPVSSATPETSRQWLRACRNASAMPVPPSPATVKAKVALHQYEIWATTSTPPATTSA